MTRVAAATLALLVVAADFAGALSVPKVPRRVYFAPAVISNGAKDPVFARLPDYLYTDISARQPIVRVDDPQAANAVVELVVSNPGPSVEVRLLEKGAEVSRISFLADGYGLLASYLEKAAGQLAPLLGPVEPRVERVLVRDGRGTTVGRELARQVRTADRFARPVELSMDGLGFIRFTDSGSPGGAPFGFASLPLVFQLSYYPSRSVGLVGSLLTYYGERLTFGQTQTGAAGTARTLLLLPGVGIRYRSLGVFFASFSATAYAGYGYVTNISSQPIGSDANGQFRLFLDPGASASIFYTTLRFAGEVGYNIAPRWGVHTGIVVNLSPNAFSNGGLFSYPSQGNSFFIQYLTLGISFRP